MNINNPDIKHITWFFGSTNPDAKHMLWLRALGLIETQKMLSLTLITRAFK